MTREWWRSQVALVAFVALIVACVAYLGVTVANSKPPNYTQIEDGLYQGGFVASPPWRTHAVLNLSETADPYSSAVHVWEPIPDAAPAPDLEWLRRQVEWVEAQRQAGRQVFVHSHNGMSRSGMVIIAYLMRKNHWSREQALDFVQTKRPITQPNSAFMELLAQWERVVLEKGPQ